METPIHTLTNLFAQLVPPSGPEEFQELVNRHRPRRNEVLMQERSFWSPAQARFLCEKVLDDAYWAELVDTLNERRRA